MPTKYLHDKTILLLLSSNIFLAFICVVLVFLRLNIGQGSEGYIIQYRSNLGISAFRTGNLVSVLSFVVFPIMILAMNVALSVRTYVVRRELSISVLAAGIILLVLAIIVSNALLVLR